MLFAERYGERIVIPSMRPAAWLAIWRDDVRQELAREPETLLSLGNPEALPLGASVTRFANAYGSGRWHGIRWSLRSSSGDLLTQARFNRPDLWEAGSISADVQRLLPRGNPAGSDAWGTADVRFLQHPNIKIGVQHRIRAIGALLSAGGPILLAKSATKIFADAGSIAGDSLYTKSLSTFFPPPSLLVPVALIGKRGADIRNDQDSDGR